MYCAKTVRADRDAVCGTPVAPRNHVLDEMSVPTGQTGRRTDQRTPDRYITLSARLGRRNKARAYRNHSMYLLMPIDLRNICSDDASANT